MLKYTDGFLNSVLFWATSLALLFGVAAAVAGFVAGLVGSELSKRSDVALNLVKRDAAKADQRASEANLRASEADQKAEDLRHKNLLLASEVEKERLERLRLEKSVRVRRLTVNDHKAIVAAYQKSKRTLTVRVKLVNVDLEPLVYGEQILNALASAGVVTERDYVPLQGPGLSPPVGLTIIGPDAKFLSSLLKMGNVSADKVTVSHGENVIVVGNRAGGF